MFARRSSELSGSCTSTFTNLAAFGRAGIVCNRVLSARMTQLSACQCFVAAGFIDWEKTSDEDAGGRQRGLSGVFAGDEV